MSTVEPKIALCICTYNRYDVLPRAIESATKQTLGPEHYEILVVDNSPDFHKSAVFSKRFAPIKNLSYLVERRPGLSNARNVAAGRTKAPFLAYMDDDAVAKPDWLEQILRAFGDFGPSAAIVGGRVDPIWSLPRPPWVHNSMLGNLSVVNWGGETRVAAPEEWVAGTNIAFRVSAILDNGGFATNLGRIGSGASLLSNEEIHLLEQIRRAGGLVIYAPDARVDHLVERSRLTRTWFRKRAAWQALSDFMTNPGHYTSQAKHNWPGLLDYFNAQSPHERTVRALLLDTDDPDAFRWQVGAIYMLTTLMLAGFEGVSLE